MTRESVQSAAASGMTADQILAVLVQNSSHGVPQNVEFSIREWSKSVLRITTRRAFLLEAPTRASADQLMAIPDLKNVIQRRLSPTVIELDEDPTQAGIVKLLRDQGFYL